MPANDEPSPAAKAVQDQLFALARLLRAVPRLPVETQALLAEILEELGNDLSSSDVPPAEVTHLSESVARLVDVVRAKSDKGLLNAAWESVDKAIIAAEDTSPVFAGLVRKLVDALSSLGI
jgi:hypothetical protein